MELNEADKERRRQQCIARNTTHGLSKTPEYSAWKEAKKRVFNKNNKRYKHYGERGITMAPEWVDDFVAFLNHVGEKPKDGRRWSLGRIDNNDNYEPGNVRWELDTEQARNHSLQSNNSTGYAGIAIRDKVIAGRTYTSYVASVTANGSKITKEFSLNKYGADEALELALVWRENELRKLEEIGIIYAQSHGIRGSN